MGFGSIHIKVSILLQHDVFLWLPRSLDTTGANLPKMSCVIELGLLLVHVFVFEFIHDGYHNIVGALVT